MFCAFMGGTKCKHLQTPNQEESPELGQGKNTVVPMDGSDNKAALRGLGAFPTLVTNCCSKFRISALNEDKNKFPVKVPEGNVSQEYVGMIFVMIKIK